MAERTGTRRRVREGELNLWPTGGTVESLRNHGTASALTAVKNHDVYRAAGVYRRLITNLVSGHR